MKKQIIFVVSAILVVGLLITLLTLFILNKDNGTTSSVDNTVSVEKRTIDWETYSTYDVNSTTDEDISITNEGVYILTGTINGKVIINANGNVKLILDNVTINSDNGPCILVKEAENVTIETKEGTINTLTDSTNYKGYEEEDGTIFSHDDLELSGSGTLIVNANYSDAVVSKDDLTITSGNYEINSKDDGIRGKDSVYIIDGTITINANGDGIKSTNDTDTDKGFILIEGGVISVTSVNDAIQAETKLVIKGGTFTIKTTGNAKSGSFKGLKSETITSISGGKFNITTTDDGIHSNGIIQIDNCDITINSNDDGIHADGLLEINGGTLDITAHEGLEATYVKINDGTINISASDDGINAGNKSSNYQVTIEINGGNITIKMGSGDTDGIDSNGDLYINGGTINITGQSPFDYDGTAKYTGGTIIVNGTTTNTITNQFMGGGGREGRMPQGDMNQGNMPGGRQRR